MEALLKKTQQQADRIQELEQELSIVRRLLEQYQGRQMNEIAARRRAAMDFYRNEYQRLHLHDHSDCSGDDEVDCLCSTCVE